MRKNNIQYHWYGDNYTEKDILKGAEDVSSRQELMELAQEEEPSPIINWVFNGDNNLVDYQDNEG